jgi:replicative DNA helicase
MSDDFLDNTAPEEHLPPPPIPFTRPARAVETTLPANEEAEQHVLACCLIDSATIDRCVNERVSEFSFFWPANQTLFMVMRDLHTAKVALDLEVLSQELTTRKLFDQVGGFPYLMQVTGKIPTTAHAGYFIAKVKELHLLREIWKRATGVIEGVKNYSGGMEEFMQNVESDLLLVTRDRAKAVRNWRDAADAAIAQLDAMAAAAPGATLGGEISWGYQDMDRAFGQMQPGQLIILAARPSIGKSSMMRHIVRKTLDNKVPAFVATLEVKDYVIARNMAQSACRISYSDLKRTRNPVAAVSFRSALSEIRGLPLHTLDDFTATSGQICAQARLLHEKHKLGLIVVDHLQEVPDGHGSRHQTTTEALGLVAKKFKGLAGELDVPVLVLSQLNRSMEKENRMPRLDDLRASGDIEQAADKVVFLHRPTHNPLTNVPQSYTADVRDLPNFYVQVEQAKGRDDGTAVCQMMFQRDIATFHPIQQ